MGPSNNWHCAQIGAFPRYMPTRQQTNSKIANCTGLECLKSFYEVGHVVNCCHSLSMAVTWSEGRRWWGGGACAELCRAESIYTRTDIRCFRLCLYVGYSFGQTLTTSVMCCVWKIMRNKMQWLIISPVACTNLSDRFMLRCPVPSLAIQATGDSEWA